MVKKRRSRDGKRSPEGTASQETPAESVPVQWVTSLPIALRCVAVIMPEPVRSRVLLRAAEIDREDLARGYSTTTLPDGRVWRTDLDAEGRSIGGRLLDPDELPTK